MFLASTRSYSGRPSSTEPHLSATGAVSCRPHFASLPALRRISAVSPQHILFAYSLSPASTSGPLSVSLTTIGRRPPGTPCFAAVDARLSYNPGLPCFPIASLIHPSIHPSIHPAVHIALLNIIPPSPQPPSILRVPVNRLHSAPRTGSLRCEPCCRGCTTSPPLIPAPPITVSSTVAYIVVSFLGFLTGMRPVCSPRLGDIRSMPYAHMLPSRHSPSHASSRFAPANICVLDLVPSHF